MPSAQVINLNPPQTENKKPFNTFAESFSNRFMENKKQQKESDALKEIYGQYQQDGQNLQSFMQNVNTNADISPTQKVNLVNQSIKFQEHNAQLQKQALEKLKLEEKIEGDKRAVADLEVKRGLEPGSLAAYPLRMAEQISRPPTERKPTQASQPIDPDQLRRIQEVESLPAFAAATIPERKRMLRNTGVSKENTDSIVDGFIEEAKSADAKRKDDRATEHLYHKETAKFDEDLFKANTGAKNQLNAINDVRKAISSEEVKPGSWVNFFKGTGLLGDKISSALMNKNEAALQASIPAFLEGKKEMFGVRLSDADLRVLQDKLPDISKSKEANLAILGIMEKYSEASLLKFKIASEIKKDNKGLRPVDYREQIEGRLDEMMKPIKIVNPKTGNTIEIPTYRLGDAIQKGGRLANE